VPFLNKVFSFRIDLQAFTAFFCVFAVPVASVAAAFLLCTLFMRNETAAAFLFCVPVAVASSSAFRFSLHLERRRHRWRWHHHRHGGGVPFLWHHHRKTGTAKTERHFYLESV